MRDVVVGWGAMLRLAIRRDRLLLPAWIVGLAVMAGGSAAATVSLYPTEASRVEAANTINASAAVVALYGRIYDPTSLGAVAMIKLTAFGAAIVGIVMVFVAIRHTRGDEEPGRLELLSGGRLGRLAPLTAAMVLIAAASLLLAVLTGLANTAAGLPASGSFAWWYSRLYSVRANRGTGFSARVSSASWRLMGGCGQNASPRRSWCLRRM